MSKVIVEMERACLQECDELRTELAEAHEEIKIFLARMEALVKYAEHTGAWCSQGMGHACTCGLSELLAACERRKA